MKILLDENLPHDLRPMLFGHEVFTVAYLGWTSLKNGLLLARAASQGFDAFVTKDIGVQYQQNLTTLPLSIVVLRAKSNSIDDIVPLVPELLLALATITPKTIKVVG